MKMKKCSFIHVSFVIALLFVSVGCDNQSTITPGDTIVKIGLIAPLSGADKSWGENGLAGIKTALSYQPLLLDGSAVELVIEDDQNRPELTRKALHKLVEEDKVAAIIVFSDSGAVLNIAEVADSYETPILAAIATHPDITRNGWISQIPFDNKTQGTVAALYVIDELIIDRVAVFRDITDTHAADLADEFVRKFEEAGGEALVIDLKSGKPDFSPFVDELKKKAIAFLYAPLGGEKVIALERATRDAGWHPQVMVSDGLLARMMLKYQDEMALVDGMLATDLYSTSTRVQRTDYGNRITAHFRELFEEPGTSFTALGCEAVSAILTAMQKCTESGERACINRKLRSGEPFPGLLGQLRITRSGKAERPTFINTIEDGELILVVKIH